MKEQNNSNTHKRYGGKSYVTFSILFSVYGSECGIKEYVVLSA